MRPSPSPETRHVCPQGRSVGILPTCNPLRLVGWKPTLLIALLFSCLSPLTVSAETPPGPTSRELWVPQNEIPNALKSAPRAVLLTREQYAALQRDAKPATAEAAEAAPAPVILRSLSMTAQPAGEIVTAQAEMSVEVLSDKPAALPLHFEPAVLAALELDETSTLAAAESPLLPAAEVQQKASPAPPRNETLALLPPGRHTLKATLHLPVAVSAAGRTIAVRGTAAGASSFSLTLPAADRIESALAWASKPGAEGLAVHTFTLPPGDKPHAITWSTRDIRDLPGTALVQVCDFSYRVDAVRLHATLNVQLLSRLAALPGALTMPVPESARVLSVDGSDVLSWEPAADKTTVAITLTPQPDRHATNFTVSLDVPLPAEEAGKARALTLPFPQLSGVHRASGRFTLHTEGDIRVLKVTPPPLAAQNTPTPEELAAMSGDFAGLWDFAAITAAPLVEIEDLAPVFHATQDTQIALQRDGVHLTRHVAVVPRQGKLFTVRATLPPGEEMLTFTQKDGAPLDWQKLSSDPAGTVLEVRFPAGLKPGDHPTLLLTSRMDPPNWTALPAAGADLTFSRATVAGADKLSGFIALAVEDRFAVSTAAAAGLEARDPATLGNDVPVRGGFVWYAPGEFTLPLHVTAHTAEFDAQFSAFALPMLHGVEIEGALDLDIRQSGLRDLKVKLPATVAPHLRFDTPLVSGTKLNAETSEWTVTLREELRGRQSLRWRILLPVTVADGARGFTAELPVLHVAGARRTATHWVMEANTDTELSFTTAGLEERDTLTLPAVAGYTPRHRVIAAWSARGSEWKLGLSARRHLPAPLPALVVDRYALTTSVSPDGALRHLAALTVRSNGQQYLDLPLPETARILTLLVDGAPQKPAASGSAALRAQLPSGSLKPITIALTWQVPGENWDGSGDRKIEPMRLGEDIPVLESTWSLRLPEGFVYSDFHSDLQRTSGPARPELDLVPEVVKRAMPSAKSGESSAAPEFMPGGGGGGGGGTPVGFKIMQSPAPDIFVSSNIDFAVSRGGNWLESQTKLITSPRLLEKAATHLSLGDAWGVSNAEAASRLADIIAVNQEDGSDVISVKVDLADVEQSTRIARALVNAYEETRREIEEDRVRRRTQALEQNKTKQAEDVEKARANMLDIMKKNGIVDFAAAGTPNTAVMTPALQILQQAISDRFTTELNLHKLKTQMESLMNLEGVQLISSAMSLGVQDATITGVAPQWQKAQLDYESLARSGLGKDHPKMVALQNTIQEQYKQLLAAVESYKGSLKVNIDQAEKMLETANRAIGEKEAASLGDKQKQNEYIAAKQEWESALLNYNSMKDYAAKAAVDETVIKKPIMLLDDSGLEPTKEANAEALPTPRSDLSCPDVTTLQRPKAKAGLLPMEFALPEAGQAFHFRGHHVPGAITFTARSLHHESRIAWLWIGAGLVAAGVLARRRPWFRGLLGALLLWLVPWIADAGMGPAHQALIGWLAGCVFVLVFRFFAKRQSVAVSVPVTAAAMVALVLLPHSPARAEEVAAGPSVIVPYDPAKPLAGQNPQQIYVDYAAFQKLWQQARDARLARNAPPPPVFAGKNAAVLSALYDATIAGGALKVEAVLTLHTSGEWASLPLRGADKSAPFAGASIVALTLDGKAAVLQEGALLVEKPGRHVLKASLQAPLTGDWRAFALQLPQAPAALVSLSHADASLRLKLNGGLPLEVREQRDGGYSWRGTAALGTAGELRIERLPAVTLAAGAERPSLGAVRARLFVTPAIERLDSRVDFAFAGAERRDFSFAFDATLTPVQIDIANLESWSVRDGAEGQRVLDFHLSVPARDGFTAGFIAERAASSKPGDEHKAPAVIPSANRQEYTLEILSSDEFDLVPQAAGGWARSELKGMGTAAETGFRSAGAWKLAGAWSPLPWLAVVQPLKRSAQADYAWKITGGMLETTVTFTLRAGEHEDLSSLAIPLPAGAALQTLDGERLKDWWRAGDTLELRFSGATGETTTVWLDFTQPVTDEHRKNGLPLPCLKLPGYEEVTGRAVLATGPETDVRLRLDDKGVFARELEAAQARGDYTFLPPLVMRRGFTFETPEFHAAALLEAVEPRFAARWVLGAAVQETWTETQFRVDVEVRQGALPEVRFTTPPKLPEARVAGAQVRETLRTLQPDGRAEYRVIFQSPVADAAQFTIVLELPHAGAIALPDIDFPGAALTERFLIMQNFSSGEILPDVAATSGVEVLARDAMQDLHFTVQGFSNPLSWRLKPGWKLAAAHRALQATSGPQAVVLYAELTTMLRADGPEWLRAVYHLQNRALQFLPLRLPEEMELVSATVAGSPVRADTGKLPDGTPGLLIPLIQTRPGDLAMDVEIVCRVKNPGHTARTLDDPDIPGVSIQRTIWNVWTPPGYDLTSADGNMEKVEEQKNFMEKLDAEIGELGSLSSIFSSGKDERIRRNAKFMAAAKIDELEKKLDAKEAESSKSRAYKTGEQKDGEYSEARSKISALKQQVQSQQDASFVDPTSLANIQSATADGTWAWTGNSSYLSKRSKDSGDQQAKLNGLTSSAWMVNGGLCTSNVALNAKLQQGQQAAGPAAKAQTEQTVRRRNAQISSLNESLQQQVEVMDESKADRDQSQLVDGEKAGKKEAAQQLFNSVRGVRKGGAANLSNQGGITEFASAQEPRDGRAAGAPVPETPAPSPVATPPGAVLGLQSNLAYAPGLTTATDGLTRATAGTPAPPAPPVLKPAGRVSIPVIFPTEGNVHRFRKVNDRAALTLTMKPLLRGASSRGYAASLLGGGLGILWLVNRKCRRHKAR